MPTPTPMRPYPWFTEQRLTFFLKVLLAVVLSLYLLGFVWEAVSRIKTIFILLIAAVFFAYIIYPLVRWMNRKLPLLVAVLLVYLAILVVVMLTLWIVIPPLTDDIAQLVRAYPTIVHRIGAFVNDPKNVVLQHAPPQVRQELTKVPDQIIGWAQMHGVQAAQHALTIILSTATLLAACVVVPVLAAYLLLESENLKRILLGLIPLPKREATLDMLSEIERVIGGFIRGQLLVGASIGILITIPLLIMHVPYAILIGVIAGLLDLIPYVGPVIAFIPAFLIALLNNGAVTALGVAIVFVAANQLEGHIIAPNIVSKTIELRPLAVLLAILIGAELGGILGMFLAVPAVGILRVLLSHIAPPKASAEEAKAVLTPAPRESLEAELEAEGELPADSA